LGCQRDLSDLIVGIDLNSQVFGEATMGTPDLARLQKKKRIVSAEKKESVSKYLSRLTFLCQL
jgi:hypothetical protein